MIHPNWDKTNADYPQALSLFAVKFLQMICLWFVLFIWKSDNGGSNI